MNFGQALETIKQGGKVARKGWNGKGIFLGLQPVLTYRDASSNTTYGSEMTHDFIYIDTTGLQTDNLDAPKDRVPWVASQTDMLADDWFGIGEGVKKPALDDTDRIFYVNDTNSEILEAINEQLSKLTKQMAIDLDLESGEDDER